jgi:acyl-CoA reductase-like NAD-dependent aldehyde dehydrogenase
MAIENTNGRHVSVIPLIINGEDVQTTATFDVTSPVTGNVLHQSSSASVEDAKRAAESSQAAFREWSKLKPHARQQLLLKAASVMEARKEELIQCQREETGALRGFAEFTFGLGVSFLKDWAGRILSLEGSVPTVAAPGQSAIVVKEPYGVILGIAPWYERNLTLPLQT